MKKVARGKGVRFYITKEERGIDIEISSQHFTQKINHNPGLALNDIALNTCKKTIKGGNCETSTHVETISNIDVGELIDAFLF